MAANPIMTARTSKNEDARYFFFDRNAVSLRGNKWLQGELRTGHRAQLEARIRAKLAKAATRYNTAIAGDRG